MRTAIYIDGFNLYYAVSRKSGHKWIDLKSLCAFRLQPQNEIVSINYFTARVEPTENDKSKHIRQDTYLRALSHQIPEFRVHFGHFRRDIKSMPLAEPPHHSVSVIKTEEKGSDVNLAVLLLNDAWNDVYDCAVIISNDADLAEALKLARIQRKLIGILAPGDGKVKSKDGKTKRVLPTARLRENSDFWKWIKPSHVRSHQLPNPIPGTTIHKPCRW